MKNIKQYWDTQVNSGNRSNAAYYLKHKAIEHSSIIKEQSLESGTIIDIGCGAGELLEYLSSFIQITSALDYSKKMLDKAGEKIGSKSGINLIHANALEYLPNATENIWLSTGALSQYLNSKEVEKLIAIFIENCNADTLILFDTIDPIRYSLVSCGIGYEYPVFLKKNEYFKNIIRVGLSFKKRVMVSLSLISFRTNIFQTVKLSSISMGYAHAPAVWHSLAKKYNLSICIVSSRYFEYRYHVIFNKNDNNER